MANRAGGKALPSSNKPLACDAEVLEGDVLDVAEYSETTNAPHASLLTTCVEIARGMLRQKWLILAICLPVVAVSVPLIWLSIKPVYTSTAMVRVSPVVSRIVFKTEDNGIVPLYKSYLNTQISILCSPRVLERVLDQPQVRETSWYKAGGKTLWGSAVSHLDRLQKGMSVQPRREQEIIDVSFSTQSAEEAKKIVNTITDEYKKMIDETLRAEGSQVLETLRSEHETLQKEINGLIETRNNLAKQIGTLDSVQLRSQLSTHLSQLEAEQTALQREISLGKWHIDQLAQQAETDTSSDKTDAAPTNQPVYADDPEWRQMHMNAEKVEHALTLARQQFGEAHPRIAQLKADLEHASLLVQERERQLEDQASRQPVVALMNPSGGDAAGQELSFNPLKLSQLLPAKQQQLTLLQQDIEQERRKVSTVSDVASRITQYEEQIKYKRDLYDTIRERLEVLEMESKAPARIRIEAYGLKPSTASQDHRVVFSIVAVVAALGLSCGVGYLRFMTDQRIHAAGEVWRVTQAPFLGQLPMLPATSVPRELGGVSVMTVGGQGALIKRSMDNTPVEINTGWLLMESMRVIRTALLERVRSIKGQVLLITSSRAETGKTSSAVLLAKSLAVIGKKVLLVEADLRRPCLAERLGVTAMPGLPAVLTGQHRDEEVIRRAEFYRFDVIVAGDGSEDVDPELLANGYFSSCVKRWRQSYDFILLDSPPVLPVADARILAGHADGTIVVLRAQHDRRGEVCDTYHQLSMAGSTLLGTIFIGSEGERKGYGGYGYGGYGYGGYGYGHYGQAREPGRTDA